MRVSVIGTGYVGLVSGVCLAEKGHDVVCVDRDQKKVEIINSGRSPIYEAGLESLIQANLGKRFSASVDLNQAVLNSEISLIAVGTPLAGSTIDLTQVRKVSEELGEVLGRKHDFHVVTVKSTVVPGTTDTTVLPILEQFSGKRAGSDFGLGVNPEFLREGEAVQDFMNPDRIVLGALDRRTHLMLRALYAAFANVDQVETTCRTAEMIKYTANALFATMISFANEIASFCDAVGDLDVVDVFRGVHLDKRLSPILDDGRRVVPSFTTYLEAGCGFGGSCFPKDLQALIAHAERHGVEMGILNSVIAGNRRQPLRVLDLLRRHYATLEGLRVAVLGLAFKPGTDDLRGSPSIPVIAELARQAARVITFDPATHEGALDGVIYDPIEYAASVEEAIESAQAIVVMTRWPEFQLLSELVRERDPPPLVVDGRRMLDPRNFRKYAGIGRGPTGVSPLSHRVFSPSVS